MNDTPSASPRDDAAAAPAAGGREAGRPWPPFPPPDAATRRRARVGAWLLSLGFLYAFALSVLAALKYGDGSLEWLGPGLMALPWSLIPTLPTVLAGGVVNAVLLHVFIRWVAQR